MIAGLLLLIQATQPAEIPAVPAPTGTVTVEHRMDIPDEIGPAMVIYLNCLASSRGSPVRNERGEQMEQVVPVGGDCASSRKDAAKRADLFLRQYTDQSGKERRALIERTLNGIDEFMKPRSYPETKTSTDAPNR